MSSSQPQSNYFSYIEDRLHRRSTLQAVLLELDTSENMIVEYQNFDESAVADELHLFNSPKLQHD